MKKAHTDAELDSLLERGGLGATRRDEILSRVLAGAAAERPTRLRWRWSLAAIGSAAAAAALLVLAPRFSPNTTSPFRAKGTVTRPSGTAMSTSLECLGGTLEACPTGSLVAVSATGVSGYVSAWAEPTRDGERIWYFSAEGASPFLDPASVAPVAKTLAAKIGPEHMLGIYVVHVRVTERPMKREQLLRMPSDAAIVSGQFLLNVTKP
jgi:hypothetical protein